MDIDIQEMKQLVVEEVTNLKKFATKEELNNLCIDTLNPFGADKCIYGQMTGNCFSDRASELIQKCCERVYETNGHPYNIIELNGKLKVKKEITNRNLRINNCFSPIECFIVINNKRPNLIKLIAYLKNETRKLILD